MTVVSTPSKYGMSGLPTDLPNHQFGFRFDLDPAPRAPVLQEVGAGAAGWMSAFFGSSLRIFGDDHVAGDVRHDARGSRPTAP